MDFTAREEDLFLVEHLNQGVVYYDSQGKIYYANKAVERLLGLNKEQFLGEKMSEIQWQFIQEDGTPLEYEDQPGVIAFINRQEVRDAIVGIYIEKEQKYHWLRVDAYPIICDKTNTVKKILVVFDDITIEKDSERRELETKQYYDGFISYTPDILYKFSSKRGALFWSGKVKDILGYEPEEMEKDPFIWNESVHPEDKRKVQEAIVNYEKGGEYSIDYRIKRKDGEWIWLHDYFMNKTILEDEIIIDGHASEITDRKNLEIEFEESKQRFELAMLATDDGLFDWNLITNEIYYSPSWKKILGYEDHELKNDFSTWETLTHPVDMKESWRMLRDHLDGKIEKFDMEFRMKHKDGHWVDILSRASAFFDASGKPVRVVGMHINLLERKKLKKSLLESERKWRFAIEGNGDGLWDWNIETNEVFFSDQWKKMLGFNPDEIENEPQNTQVFVTLPAAM
jgi:PAS domain S-box-containing protein